MANCAKCGKKLRLFRRYFDSELGYVCEDCSIALVQEADECKSQEKQNEEVTNHCPICQTNVAPNVWETGQGFYTADTTTCTVCGALLEGEHQ